MYRAIVVLLLLPLALRAAEDEKAARALLGRAIEAMGGEKLLSRPHALTGSSTGTLRMNKDEAITNRFTVQGVDRVRWETDLGSTTIILGFEGGKAWIAGNGGKANELSKEQSEALRRGFLALRVAETLVPLSKGWKLSHLGELDIDGTRCVGVKATRKGEPDIDLQFDKKTLLPVKVEIRLVKPGESAETALSGRFSGYKKIEGRQYFTTLVVDLDGMKVLEMDRKDVKMGDEADPATFKNP